MMAVRLLSISSHAQINVLERDLTHVPCVVRHMVVVSSCD